MQEDRMFNAITSSVSTAKICDAKCERDECFLWSTAASTQLLLPVNADAAYFAVARPFWEPIAKGLVVSTSSDPDKEASR